MHPLLKKILDPPLLSEWLKTLKDLTSELANAL